MSDEFMYNMMLPPTLLLMDGPFESASLRGEIVGTLEHLWAVFHCISLFANHILQRYMMRAWVAPKRTKNESCCEEKRLKTRTPTTVPSPQHARVTIAQVGGCSAGQRGSGRFASPTPKQSVLFLCLAHDSLDG